MDQATPNLPSRDFDQTSAFYGALGFTVMFRDQDWMILRRDGLVLECFPHPTLIPAKSWFSCCLRLADVDAFFDMCRAADVPERDKGFPRIMRPRPENGMMIGALVDPHGTLLRLIQSD